jgi:hypothetical protein
MPLSEPLDGGAQDADQDYIDAHLEEFEAVSWEDRTTTMDVFLKELRDAAEQ